MMNRIRQNQTNRRAQQTVFYLLLTAVLLVNVVPELRASALDPIPEGRAAVVLNAGEPLRPDQILVLGTEESAEELTLTPGRKAVITCGETVQYATTREGEDLDALLRRTGVTVGALEVVRVDASGEEIAIDVASDFVYYETVAEFAAYGTDYGVSYRVPKGETQTVRAGVNGTRDVTYEIVYADGQLVSRQAVYEGESTAVNELVCTGTLVQEAARGDTIAEVITEEDGSGWLILASGDSLHFSGTKKVTCTAYTTGYDGVGTITYTGTRVHVGSMAVDKSVIPLGTRMFVVGSTGYSYGYGVAEDTGVKGEWIDLFMNTYNECKQFGLQRNSTAYILD